MELINVDQGKQLQPEASHEDIELGLKGKDAADSGGEENNEFMNSFFQEVGTIKTAMSNIRRNVKSIEEKYVQSLNSISIDQGGSIKRN